MIFRDIQTKVEHALSQQLVAIVYGARQTGKTTLAKQISIKYTNPLYLTCDDPTTVINLTERSTTELKAYIGNADMVIIDEAQRVENIGTPSTKSLKSRAHKQLTKLGLSEEDILELLNV